MLRCAPYKVYFQSAPYKHDYNMQPPTDTFDPYDQAGTTAWLDAFAALEEDGPYGHLDFVEAGVHEFEFVSGQPDEWVSTLREKVNEVLPDVDAKSFVEVDKAEFQQELVKLLRTSMAYSAEMLKEKAANNWASSFVSSMDGGKFFRPADGSPPIADATFETIFVAVVGTRLAYVLIIDED
mgnify:FL=1